MENDQVRKPICGAETDYTWKGLLDSTGVMGKEGFIVDFEPANGSTTRRSTHQA
jgi:hypothetical protein